MALSQSLIDICSSENRKSEKAEEVREVVEGVEHYCILGMNVAAHKVQKNCNLDSATDCNMMKNYHTSFSHMKSKNCCCCWAETQNAITHHCKLLNQ